MIDPVDLSAAADRLTEHWSPRVVGRRLTGRVVS